MLRLEATVICDPVYLGAADRMQDGIAHADDVPLRNQISTGILLLKPQVLEGRKASN
jgi:hypothetical protein